MTVHQRDMAIQDFEKFMRNAIQHEQGFSFDIFISFSTSLINFYQGSNLIKESERKDTALILSQAFNAGMGNRITADDLDEISTLIISDRTIDYSILNPIFA
ncbi:hypothetical protein [Sphingobacterium paludis]|uniref:Uncharacterized protein n=1 Tax=Sphingobacterium paludis TaxID=1476465 RepID=A0A4R7DDV0_9SPHI|nr:hypothetical protein [Sphingobacterium paludis]TDS17336.1 hypothetical protein B0I21_101201 [Sphingobacterium paludis]